MNKTPIFDFVKKYSKSNSLRAHMPGHKGKTVLGVEKLDITEIRGADVLYSACGIIKQSEEKASKLFGTDKTLYSTEGSSLAIRAMLLLSKKYAVSLGVKPKIAAARNVHKAFVTSAGILDLDVDFICPHNNLNIITSGISKNDFLNYLEHCEEKPTALYLTSPDYLGNITDIKGLASVCKENGILLLVDNAHGAYLNFLDNNLHPITLGADLCCDSAHKTLPVLTGGAYLHISKKAPKFIKENAADAMALFASTSPSYLILQSLDVANEYLENYNKKLSAFVAELDKVKSKLLELGYTLIGDEPLKLTVFAKDYGYLGTELAEILIKKRIEPEFYDKDYLCLMLTPSNYKRDFDKILKVFKAIKKLPAKNEKAPRIEKPQRACSINDAMFKDFEILAVSKCEGRIFADGAVSCPPAIPVIISGEVITKNSIALMKYYGIKKCKVIK